MVLNKLMLKITCAPAKHLRILKSGAIRHQKSPVANPPWRFAVLTDDGNLFGRLFPSKPTLDVLWGCMAYVLDQQEGEIERQALIAASLDKAIPGFAPQLQAHGFELYVPRGSSGGLATVAKRWDGFLTTLDFCMRSVSEADLTLGESVALARNSQGVTGPIKQGEDFEAAHAFSKQVCLLRGRDPEEGARRWQSTGFQTKPHTSVSKARDHDELASLIENYSPDNVPPGYVLTPEAQRIHEIAQYLHGVCRAPTDSNTAQAGKRRLARVLQQYALVEATDASMQAHVPVFSGYLSPLELELSRWLGFASEEMHIFSQGLTDACRLPLVIDGATHVFFRLPVQWRFLNGLEQTRKLRYLPWREIAEQQLATALPTACRVVLSDDFRNVRPSDKAELSQCRALLHAMRHGRRYGEEKGKRASAAVPKGQSEPRGESTLVGLIRHPVVGAAAPSWRPNVDQVLAEAASTINANLAKTLDGLTLLLRKPIPM